HGPARRLAPDPGLEEAARQPAGARAGHGRRWAVQKQGDRRHPRSPCGRVDTQGPLVRSGIRARHRPGSSPLPADAQRQSARRGAAQGPGVKRRTIVRELQRKVSDTLEKSKLSGEDEIRQYAKAVIADVVREYV